MHTLVVIGGMGIKRAYLDIPREEALRRWKEAEGEDSFGVDGVVEFEFKDEFGAYDVWPHEGKYTFHHATKGPADNG